MSHEILGLAEVGADEVGATLGPKAQRVAGAVDDDVAAMAADPLHDLGVELLGHLARQRAGKHDETGALGEVVGLLEELLDLRRGHDRTVLDDLRLPHRRRVDDHRRGPRLAGDVREVVEDVLALQTLRYLLPGEAADEPGDDDGIAEALERSRDVDALAARERQALTGAVAMPGLEVGHRERLVDGGVRCDRDDQGSPSRCCFIAEKPAHRAAPARSAPSIAPRCRLDTARVQGYVSKASRRRRSSLGEAPVHIEAVARKRPETPTGRTGITEPRSCPKRLRL